MADTKQQIIKDIDKYLNKNHTWKFHNFCNSVDIESNVNPYSKFYIGITNNIERRLFQEHNVFEQEKEKYTYAEAIDDKTAREVELHFLDKGMQGGSGGGGKDAVLVYCYEISEETKQ